MLRLAHLFGDPGERTMSSCTQTPSARTSRSSILFAGLLVPALTLGFVHVSTSLAQPTQPDIIKAQQPSILTTWEGAARISTNENVRVIFEFTGMNSGLLSIPQRSMDRIPMIDCEYTEKVIRCAVVDMRSRKRIDFEFDVAPTAPDVANGHMKQNDRQWLMTIRKNERLIPRAASTIADPSRPTPVAHTPIKEPQSRIEQPLPITEPADKRWSETIHNPSPVPSEAAVTPSTLVAEQRIEVTPAPASASASTKPSVETAKSSAPSELLSADLLRGIEGAWQGRVKIADGLGLEVSLAVDPDAGPGKQLLVSIPDQRLDQRSARSLSPSAQGVSFALSSGTPVNTAADARFVLQPSSDNNTLTGTMDQFGARFPITLVRMTNVPTASVAQHVIEQPAGPAPVQPQPQPSAPYDSRDVTYTNPSSTGTLAGTLTTPRGVASAPAVILITGSGAQDRDETILGHKPFALIADVLTRRGIAVLRVDDPGTGGSTDPRGIKATTDDFVTDVRASLNYLKGQPGIDPSRIGLLGHSEGGLIASLLAADNPDVAFVILFAGPGVSGASVLIEQNRELAMLTPAGKKKPEAVEAMIVAYRAAADALVANKPDDELRPLVRALVQKQVALNSPMPIPEATLDQLADAGLKQFTSPWLKRFMAIDPVPALKRVNCPVLVLNGGKDTQVLARQNVPAIIGALLDAPGGKRDVTARIYPDLNHLFQPAKTGSPDEYGTIKASIAPEVLRDLADWTARVTKLDETKKQP